ncbi:hypothetical protein GGI10_002693 [Coemansia sp. RSA 2530]|nr:hypothetical protein GGI10_002693 [Coemansia sp. RSA 2530]
MPELDYQSSCESLEELECSEEDAIYVDPVPKSFVPERPINPYRLRNWQLQAIVGMSNIELPSKKSVYGSKGWRVAGLDNKCIIVAGIFFYNVDNITQCSLEFCKSINALHKARTENQYHAYLYAYDVKGYPMGKPACISQELGSVDIEDGLCVVFPNTYQYKMSRIARGIASKPGHCKMLTFYYVDPSKRIPSTKIVPPQQKDWWMEQVLASKPLCNLPLLVVDGIMDRVDSPISLKNIKQIRLDMEAEVKKKMAGVSYKYFEPSSSIKYASDYC